ncbi:hypothetical protein EYZ11_000235 [Aspergillus tanneri]|uniref:Uncharacterized protein n=1 Tax=Aspergillus tanneri TaxID=1220188 RepID=A0A4S3JXQ9_9EURO|nr:uncharacterized protein ATNIH1004_006463 [Aspergillus tanneri]KAA8647762.1 hypothetical protein ATNIH1004_006463 [Aspergillus tanneri]THD00342.1 hypothetical protein EYZ11_000235 [Aspergillus tanneri]
MPILFCRSSSRLFESTPCPARCIIPTGDPDAYDLYPKFRWAYNKLTVAELQGIKCGPHETEPDHDLYPIFSKPIYNLGGLGADARLIRTQEDYWRSHTPGHMWSALLTGKHYSTDIAVIAGRPVWFAHTRGMADKDQTWDYWEVNVTADCTVQQNIAAFIESHVAGYTGMVNMETIGGKIIEIHLRFSPQWPDLYGPWFLPSLVDLYCGKGWTGPCLAEAKTRTGYSVPLFGDEKYALISSTIKHEQLREMEIAFNVSSITMGYDKTMPMEGRTRPTGGFRLAWINGFDLEKCKFARRMFQIYLHNLFDIQVTVDLKARRERRKRDFR